MGWAFVISKCFTCHHTFAYNPLKVPSLRIDGVREPICRGCLETANQFRVANGDPPHPILPGAYDPMPEEELP